VKDKKRIFAVLDFLLQDYLYRELNDPTKRDRVIKSITRSEVTEIVSHLWRHWEWGTTDENDHLISLEAMMGRIPMHDILRNAGLTSLLELM